MMTKQELSLKLNGFIQLAFISPQNMWTGFLTGHRVNILTNEQILGFSLKTENIVTQMVQQLKNVSDGGIPDYYECGTLFQYVFDKTTEAMLKLIMDGEINTQFDLKEAFKYHEPDLPYYIQLKLTNVVGKLATISKKILIFLDEEKVRTKELDNWMTVYLMVSAIIAIQFALEIDPDDDSEMQAYLNS